jgi:hypothetical protein
MRFLCIVARDQPDLFDHLRERFAGDRGVEVTLDRRRGERRQGVPQAEQERRRAHRRWHPDNHETLSSVGVFLVPLDRDQASACSVS